MNKMNVNVNLVKETEATAITHGGLFHADEVLATVMLAIINGFLALARVFRVPENTDAFVYDIGGGQYDHHQRGGNGSRENGVPYASCGLVWREYANIILQKLGCPDALIGRVKERVDLVLIQGVDAIDNGFAQYDLSPRYQACTISHAISEFNPAWDSDKSGDEAFLEAVSFAEDIFMRVVENAISAVRAEALVQEALADSAEHVLVLDRFMPWQTPLLTDASEKAAGIWYVVFPSNRGGYNIQCVPPELGSFDQRHPFPTEWKGNPAATGIQDCTFVHPTGFMASCGTLEGALSLAERAAANA